MSRPALDELGDELGRPVPEGFGELTDADLRRLTQALRSARRDRQAAIDTGANAALRRLARLRIPNLRRGR